MTDKKPKPDPSIYQKLVDVMPAIKLAMSMAAVRLPGGKIELGIIASKPAGENPGGGTGVVAARLDATFLDDFARFLGLGPGWLAPEEKFNDVGRAWKGPFQRWAAGYFSWVEEAEQMPTDLDDHMRTVEDAFEAGRAWERHNGADTKP
jgi:hypothetical protein